MMRNRKISDKEKRVAHYLSAGLSPRSACAKAGYKPSMVRSYAAVICRRERVKAELLEIEARIGPGDLTRMGKSLIQHKLTSAKKLDKETLGYLRTGCELEGTLGNHVNAELHLHAHRHEEISPEVAEMVAQAVKRAFSTEQDGNK
jgi:hypothetical protein